MSSSCYETSGMRVLVVKISIEPSLHEKPVSSAVALEVYVWDMDV